MILQITVSDHREPWELRAREHMHMSPDMYIHISIMAVRRSMACLLPVRTGNIMMH